MKYLKLFEKYKDIDIIPNKIVIHVSNPLDRESILKNGLEPKYGEQRTDKWTKDKRLAIFATNSKNIKKSWNSTYDDDIWEIDTSIISNKWYSDSNFDWQSKNIHLVTFDAIPVNAIKLIYKGTGNDLLKKGKRGTLVESSIEKEDFQDEIFYEENDIFNEEIRKIAYLIAEDINEEIDINLKNNYLGAGDFGYAFLTKSNKVLKITSDETELHIAQKLSKNRNWFGTLINYYSIGKIDYDDYSNTYTWLKYTNSIKKFKYYLLMDRVYPINDIEKCVIKMFYKKLIQMTPDYYENIMNPDLEKNIIEFFENDEMKSIALKFLPLVRNIVKELKSHKPAKLVPDHKIVLVKVERIDFHGKNLGWNKSHEKLILFDLCGHLKGGELKRDMYYKPKQKKFEEFMNDDDEFLTKTQKTYKASEFIKKRRRKPKTVNALSNKIKDKTIFWDREF